MEAPAYDPSQPREIVMELLQHRKSGTVLDVGAGRFGNNAFFLAKHGFKVTATEHSDKLFPQLDQLNQEAGDVLKLDKAKLLDYQPDQDFDIVICAMLLHSLKNKTEVRQAIDKLQRWTKPGGLCLATVYTDKNPICTKSYLFRENELKSYFDDWQIIKYESAVATIKDELAGLARDVYSDRLIAQKLS